MKAHTKRPAPNTKPIDTYRNQEPIMIFVEEERRRQGVSRAALACRAGVAHSAFRNCLVDGHSPTLTTATSLLGALGYQLEVAPLDKPQIAPKRHNTRG